MDASNCLTRGATWRLPLSEDIQVGECLVLPFKEGEDGYFIQRKFPEGAPNPHSHPKNMALR